MAEAVNESEKVLHIMAENHRRVVVLGKVDAGKTAFIGTQVSGKLDDGRGCARASAMKHRHEKETGRTSSIATHLIGLDQNAKPVRPTSKHALEGEVVLKAARVITLMDLAGHEKYLRTAIAGVNHGMADYALVLVNGMQPPNHMTLHHLKLCVNIPVIVVVAKIDSAPKQVLETTTRKIKTMLRHKDLGMRPFVIRTRRMLKL